LEEFLFLDQLSNTWIKYWKNSVNPYVWTGSTPTPPSRFRRALSWHHRSQLGIMITPSMEERRIQWQHYPCNTPEFNEQRTAGCRCATCIPGRAGGTPSDADSPNWVADQARYEQDEAGDTVRALSFEEPLSAQDPTPDKTIIPFKQGERESGVTPGGAEGWQQTNFRVAIAYDEAGRSETTPINLATPTRHKQV
jgi:hypothetical protein